jgi:hypothetical protein
MTRFSCARCDIFSHVEHEMTLSLVFSLVHLVVPTLHAQVMFEPTVDQSNEPAIGSLILN